MPPCQDLQKITESYAQEPQAGHNPNIHQRVIDWVNKLWDIHTMEFYSPI